MISKINNLEPNPQFCPIKIKNKIPNFKAYSENCNIIYKILIYGQMIIQKNIVQH